MMFGRGATAGDDAVDARRRLHLLPKHADVVERLDDGVERVDAFPRIGGGVRRFATELEPDAHDSEQILMEDPRIPAVTHHRCVDVLEDPGPDELHLAAAALLGRRPDHLDAALRQRIAHGGERGAGTGAGSGNGVVAARVSDGGQRVVLAHDRDRGPGARFDGGAEGRLDASDAALDLESLVAEEFGEPADRLDFLVRELRVVVDRAGQAFEVVAEAVDGLVDDVFHAAHGNLRNLADVERRRVYSGL
jgi:hypothetical protein